ncbi:hypothetical protein [Haloarcula argentinensis]|uniref:Uncharacterized protein n=1 Tax=Haloarcula argentinensis TaxID=43776 RepID=A0A847UJN0_HALAR|nr:hypothetical protein [Haloarcula argentinensis]NLV11844.1 hypothetical protein [Haloarcula argentinensis]
MPDGPERGRARIGGVKPVKRLSYELRQQDAADSTDQQQGLVVGGRNGYSLADARLRGRRLIFR